MPGVCFLSRVEEGGGGVRAGDRKGGTSGVSPFILLVRFYFTPLALPMEFLATFGFWM